MCFFPSKGGKIQKLDQVGLVASPRSLHVVFKFNEKALKDFNSNLIWLLLQAEKSTKSKMAVHEQEWGQRPFSGAVAEVLIRDDRATN